MFSQTNLSNVLRSLSAWLRVPVMLVLIVLAAVTVVMAGSLVAEFFTERLRMRAKLPQLADEIAGNGDLDAVIEKSGLTKRQKRLLRELTAHPELNDLMREALARKLISSQEAYYNGITKISDVIAKLGPMFGLLGTLIPLGPGLIALGQGDTYTLSQSLLTAFDTTVAGLSTAAVAFVISTVRKHWYEDYMASAEALAECILEKEKEGTQNALSEICADEAAENDGEENPIDGLANLADIMLVLACGLMLSLVISWNVDLGGLSAPVELDRSEGMEEIEGVEAADKERLADSNTYEKMGTVYKDPETGAMYLLTDG